MNKSNAIRGASWGLHIGVPLGIALYLVIGIDGWCLDASDFLCLMIFFLPIALAGIVGGAIGGAIASTTKEEAERDKRIRLLGSLCGALAALVVALPSAGIMFYTCIYIG